MASEGDGGDEGEPRDERDRIRYGSPPIFCEQCPDLAMAVVDDSALCRRCMMAALENRPVSWIAEHARSLPVQPS